MTSGQYVLYVIHMIRTQVFLPEETHLLIKIQAQKERRPAAEIIREALEKGMKSRSTKNAGDGLLKLAGLGIKGPRDLSKNIDKYLYE